MHPVKSTSRLLAILASGVVALTLSIGPANAAVCHGCDDPELPGDPGGGGGGGTSCTFAATTEPSITTVQPRVGSKVNGNKGTWSGNPTSFGYQWMLDGSAIPGATSLTSPVLSAGALDRPLVLRVIAHKAGCASKVDHSPAKTVAKGHAVLAVTQPVLSFGDRPRVGEPITVTPGTWSSPPDSVTYRWHLDSSSVPGENSATYVPGPEAKGKLITAMVIANKAAHYSALVTVELPRVTAAATKLVWTKAPSVTGEAVFKSLLRANPGTITGGATVGYQWRRDGVDIAGADKRNYRPRVADVGRRLSVRIVAEKPGTRTLTRNIQLGRVAKAPMTWAGPKFRLVGTPQVGGTLKSALSKATLLAGTDPVNATRVKYRWTRDHKAINKATTEAFKVRAADKGKVLRLEVTLSRGGYEDLVMKVAKRIQ